MGKALRSQKWSDSSNAPASYSSERLVRVRLCVNYRFSEIRWLFFSHKRPETAPGQWGDSEWFKPSAFHSYTLPTPASTLRLVTVPVSSFSSSHPVGVQAQGRRKKSLPPGWSVLLGKFLGASRHVLASVSLTLSFANLAITWVFEVVINILSLVYTHRLIRSLLVRKEKVRAKLACMPIDSSHLNYELFFPYTITYCRTKELTPAGHKHSSYCLHMCMPI